MSEPRFMIGSAEGAERGPFTKAELRWMWRRNQIDDTTRLRAESADVWITARSMAAELDAAGEETEVLAPEPEPPVLPAVVANAAVPAVGTPPLQAKGRPVLQPVQIVSMKVPFDQVLALCFKASVALTIIWIGISVTLWTLSKALAVLLALINNPSFQQGVRQGMGQ